jgi:hypothetical protein
MVEIMVINGEEHVIDFWVPEYRNQLLHRLGKVTGKCWFAFAKDWDVSDLKMAYIKAFCAKRSKPKQLDLF